MSKTAKQQQGKRRGKRRDPRPYIRDSWKQAGASDRLSPAHLASAGIGMVVLALALGFAIGLAVFAVMNLSIWLTELLWNGTGLTPHAPWFALLVCPLGGLLIGLWTHYSHDRVHELEEVLHEFRTTGSFRLQSPGKAVVSFLLPLIFGGSVGFEAGLTGLVTAGCCWIRDRLKAMGLQMGAVADASIAASLSAIFGAPLAGIVAGAESSHEAYGRGERGGHDGAAERGEHNNAAERVDRLVRDGLTQDERDNNPSSDPERSRRNVDAYTMRRSVKLVLYLSAALGAFGGMRFFSWLFGNASGLPRFDAIQASGVDYLWVLPCLLLAYLLSLVFHTANFASARLALQLDGHPFGTIAKPLVAGVVLGIAALAFPLVLFPGESQSHELMGTWQAWTATALLGTGILKAAITPMCVRLGWVGGIFFPCIFAGVACGFGLAQITGADPMLLVTVTTSGFLAGATRKPLLSVAILALCFPLTGLLFSGLAAVIVGTLPLPLLVGESLDGNDAEKEIISVKEHS